MNLNFFVPIIDFSAKNFHFFFPLSGFSISKYQFTHVFFSLSLLRDRLRTTSNVIGNCFAAAIIEKMFKKELDALDAEQQTDDKLNQIV